MAGTTLKFDVTTDEANSRVVGFNYLPCEADDGKLKLHLVTRRTLGDNSGNHELLNRTEIDIPRHLALRIAQDIMNALAEGVDA